MAHLTQQRGHKGYQTRTDRDGNKMVTLTSWETREDADRTLNSDWMRQTLALFADTFAAMMGTPQAPHESARILESVRQASILHHSTQPCVP